MDIQKDIEINEDGSVVTVKNPLYSKTVYANLLVTISSILTIVDPTLLGIDARYLLLASGVINIILRFMTQEKVSFNVPVAQK